MSKQALVIKTERGQSLKPALTVFPVPCGATSVRPATMLRSWYCAYDLGMQLAKGTWSRPLHECLEGVTCPDMLKTILEAVQAAVLCVGPLGGSSSGGMAGGEPAGVIGQE